MYGSFLRPSTKIKSRLSAAFSNAIPPAEGAPAPRTSRRIASSRSPDPTPRFLRNCEKGKPCCLFFIFSLETPSESRSCASLLPPPPAAHRTVGMSSNKPPISRKVAGCWIFLSLRKCSLYFLKPFDGAARVSSAAARKAAKLGSQTDCTRASGKRSVPRSRPFAGREEASGGCHVQKTARRSAEP